tara:strand:- start:523 stop:984 length:462 start_codon:yes stop_codon:yes gene_type:complete
METVATNRILQGIRDTKYLFIDKPIVLGGLALEYYGIRSSGPNFDYIVSSKDWNNLEKAFPDKINAFGGNSKYGSKINLHDNLQINLISNCFNFNYDEISKNALEFEFFKIIDLEKQLLIKTLSAVNNNDMKSKNDQKFIVNYIVNHSLNKSN